MNNPPYMSPNCFRNRKYRHAQAKTAFYFCYLIQIDITSTPVSVGKRLTQNYLELFRPETGHYPDTGRNMATDSRTHIDATLTVKRPYPYITSISPTSGPHQPTLMTSENPRGLDFHPPVNDIPRSPGGTLL